jgi:hypothetical protein
MSSKHIRNIQTEVKMIDEAKGIVDYIASSDALDSYRERILQSGWKFNRFAKNAPFVDSHDYGSIEKLLGKVTDYKVKGNQLIERVQWAIDTDQPLAKLGFDLTRKGYLRAVSVGFMPIKMSWQGKDDWAQCCTTMGLTVEQALECRAIYLEQEQIELSACVIGANPDAVAKAFDAADISEEQLRKVGFKSDDDLQFLLDIGRSYASANPAEKAIAKHMLLRITGNSLTNSAPSPCKPSGDDEAKLREDKRRSLLDAIRRAKA